MPPFDLNKAKKTKTEITFNYYELPVRDVQKSKDFVSANYVGMVNEPNLIITKGIPQNYQAMRAYIFGKLHDIKGIVHDGELVIEHRSLTSSEKIFVCFLLRTKKTANSEIDTFLSNSDYDINIELNMDIDKTAPVIIYKSVLHDCTVVINTAVIQIKTDISAYSLDTDLFDVTADKYNLIVYDNTFEGFVAGGQEITNTDINGDLLECDMINVATDMVETYNIPINSEILGAKETAQNLSTGIIVVFSIFASVFIFLISNPIYNYIKTIRSLNSYFLPVDIRYNLLNGIGIQTWFSVILFTIGSICVFIIAVSGAAVPQPALLTVALYLAIVIVIPIISVNFHEMLARDGGE